MKKTLLMCAFVIAFANLAHSQDVVKSRYGWGFVGGLNMFGTYKLGVPQKKIQGGLLGFDFYYKVLKNSDVLNLHFQPNWTIFNYDNGKGRQNDKEHIQRTSETLVLPFLLRFSPLAKKKIGIFIEGGVGLQHRFKDTSLMDLEVNCIAAPCDFNWKNTESLLGKTTSERIVILASVGTELNLGGVQIPISLRINEGIGTYKLNDQNYSRRTRDNIGDYKTRTIQIVTGVTF